MKSFIVTLLFFTSIQAHALSGQQILKLYESGKTQEITLEQAKLPSIKKNTLLKKMNIIAEDLSIIWSDTILEGPYSLLENPSLDVKNISALLLDKKIIGFIGYVRAEAAFNDNCDFNYDIEETVAEQQHTACLQDYKGAIVEKFLVDAEGERIEGLDSYADFED